MRFSPRPGWARAAVASGVVVVLGMTTACGSRVPEARIRMAAGVAGTEVLAGAAAPDQGTGVGAPAPGGAVPPAQAPPGDFPARQTAAPAAAHAMRRGGRRTGRGNDPISR